jgi:hypothetical protein
MLLAAFAKRVESNAVDYLGLTLPRRSDAVFGVAAVIALIVVGDISQVFVSGLLLGWMRWASGSTILTILLHALINFEGMIETLVGLKWPT